MAMLMSTQPTLTLALTDAEPPPVAPPVTPCQRMRNGAQSYWNSTVRTPDRQVVIGTSVRGRPIIAEHWGGEALTPEDIERFDHRKEALYRQIVAADYPIMPGAVELLRGLKSAGFRLAVASSGPPENVALAVERLGAGPLLDAQVTGRDVTRGKPDPQVFLLAARRVAIPPETCAVVEHWLILMLYFVNRRQRRTSRLTAALAAVYPTPNTTPISR